MPSLNESTIQPYGIATCQLCSLAGKSPVILCRGAEGSGLVIVGEAPAEEERKQAAAFAGPSGKLLDHVLREAGLEEWNPWITNAVKCYSAKNPDKTQVGTCSRYYLAEEIAAYPRRLVVALGGSAHLAVGCKVSSGVTKRLGVIEPNELFGCDVLYGMHPSAVLHNADSYDMFYAVFERAARYMAGTLPRPEESHVETHTVENSVDFERALAPARQTGVLALDTETTGLDWRLCDLLGFSFSPEPGMGYWVPWDLYCSDPSFSSTFKRYLNDPAIIKVFHHAKFDLHILQRFIGPVLDPIEDTMLWAYFVQEGRSLSLKSQLRFRLNVPEYALDFDEDGPYGVELSEKKRGDLATYAALDAGYTYRLYQHFKQAYPDVGELPAHRLMLESTRLLEEAETAGLLVDSAALDEAGRTVDALVEDTLWTLRELAGESFNPNSHPQVGKQLYQTYCLQPQKQTDGGANSSDEEALQRVLDALSNPQVAAGGTP